MRSTVGVSGIRSKVRSMMVQATSVRRPAKASWSSSACSSWRRWSLASTSVWQAARIASLADSRPGFHLHSMSSLLSSVPQIWRDDDRAGRLPAHEPVDQPADRVVDVALDRRALLLTV